MSAQVLVTGGAGFIGSNLVRALLERGDEVRVLDNFSTGSRANLDGLDVEIVEGELRSYERVHNAVRGVEIVFHLGALGSVPRSVQDPLTSSAVNVEGTLNVLLAARDEGVRRVVFSSSIVGLRHEPRDADDARPRRPTRSRRTASRSSPPSATASPSAASTTSFETVVLRYFNVFGPRQSPSSQYAAVIPLFITAIAAGEPVTIHGDGEQSRDFTYVDNVVDATIRAAPPTGASGRVFNVAGGAPASVNDVADDDRRRSSASRSRGASSRRAPATSATRGPTSTAARAVLGYEPSVVARGGAAAHRGRAARARWRPSRSASCA